MLWLVSKKEEMSEPESVRRLQYTHKALDYAEYPFYREKKSIIHTAVQS